MKTDEQAEVARLMRKVINHEITEREPHNGYLILQGRGLPRITVVGFAREVSWPTMVAQLRAIAASGGPVLE